MDQKVIEFNKSFRNKKYPEFQAGDVVRISRKIKEGDKERTQVFEGLIIAIKAKQSSSPKMTVRKVTNGYGVELIVPIYSPVVENIELVKRAKVRRAKLYYIRTKSAKESRMKYKDISEFLNKEEEPVDADPSAEEAGVIADKKEKVEEVKEEKEEESKAEDKKEMTSKEAEAEKKENKPEEKK